MNPFPPSERGDMSTDRETPLSETGFLRVAVAAGLDTSDTEAMADLRRRVNLMREGLSRLYEIDVSGAESPSAFVPVRR